MIDKNDPLFEYDTFELRDGSGEEVGPLYADQLKLRSTSEPIRDGDPVSKGYFHTMFKWVLGDSASPGSSVPMERSRAAPRTPFSKLSSFHFRKELGRGAFGKVMLVETKADGRKFALKILSKRHMKTSDKKQLRAERDILHSMAEKSPHPFTTGLKFAFQSENNLYLGKCSF